MKKTPRPASGYRIILLLAIFAASGCESIALRPQPDVDRRGIERTPDDRGSPTPDDRGSAKDEIIGTVERVDRTSNEIRLRTTEAKVIVIKYDPTLASTAESAKLASKRYVHAI